MRYTCLLIDHDDTTVDSTPHIHYPAHKEQMRRLGRAEETLSLEDWFLVNYDPGISHYLQKILALTKEEEQLCYEIWRSYTTKMVPRFFDGILDILKEFRDRGGRIVVVSHSEPDIIASHYKVQDYIPGFMPDRIIGWEGDRDKHKPNPWPVDSVVEEYRVPRDEILVVDDLMPGIVMARRGSVDSVAAVWSHGIRKIRDGLSGLSTHTAASVSDFEKILFTG